jgi:hypothetical protein
VNHSRLGSVVGGLHLREVHNVATHGGGGYKATICEVGKLVAVQIGSLLLLPPPVSSGVLGAVKGTVQVNVNHTRVVVKGPVNHGSLGPRDTRVGNENVQTAIEVLHSLINRLLDSLGVCNIDLISLGCEKLGSLCPIYLTGIKSSSELILTLYTILGRNLSRPLCTLRVGAPPQGNVGTCFSQTLSHGETNASTSTRDNGSFALEREHLHQARMFRGGGVFVYKTTTLIDWVGSHCERRAE